LCCRQRQEFVPTAATTAAAESGREANAAVAGRRRYLALAGDTASKGLARWSSSTAAAAEQAAASLATATLGVEMMYLQALWRVQLLLQPGRRRSCAVRVPGVDSCAP